MDALQKYIVQADEFLAVPAAERTMTLALAFQAQAAAAQLAFQGQAAKEAAEVQLAHQKDLEDHAAKYRLLQLKYLAVSSRFWLEKLFDDVDRFVRAKNVTVPKYYSSKCTAMNRFLLDKPRVWRNFVRFAQMSLKPPLNASFPAVSESLLYGRLSNGVHEPPGLVVLDLWNDTSYSDEVYLLRDLGKHYAQKLGLAIETFELSRTHADLMRPDRPRRFGEKAA